MIQPFRAGLVVGLAVILQIMLLGCGPAAATISEPAPTHAPPAAAIRGGDPERPVRPTESPSRLDERLAEIPASPPRLVAPEVEPVASREALSENAGRPVGEPAGEQASTVESVSDAAGGAVGEQPAQQRPYTWRDGDRTMTALLQPALTVTQGGDIEPRSKTAVKTKRSDAADKADTAGSVDTAPSATMPVFQSQSGTLMTLPGGVLLALDKSWSGAETDAFFDRNGILPDRVSELDYIANGFFVDTQSGFPSLDLANALATQDGVRVSTPNWRRELVAE